MTEQNGAETRRETQELPDDSPEEPGYSPELPEPKRADNHQKIGSAEPARASIIKDWAQLLLMAFIVVFGFVRPFIAEPYKIPSGSMEDTLFRGDRVLVLKFTYGAKLPATSTRLFDYRGPSAGDVFVFTPKHSPLEHFIKRAVAVPGDAIASDGSQLLINGKRLLDEEYAKPAPYANNEPFRNSGSGIRFPPFQRGYPSLVPYYLEQPEVWESVKPFIHRSDAQVETRSGKPTHMTIGNAPPYRISRIEERREYDRRIPVRDYYFVEAVNRNNHPLRGALYKNVKTRRWTFSSRRTDGNVPEAYTMPPRHYFAVGDNRLNSQDSRVWGPVPYDVVKGRAVWIYWSNDPDAPTWTRRRWLRPERIGRINNRYGRVEL